MQEKIQVGEKELSCRKCRKIKMGIVGKLQGGLETLRKATGEIDKKKKNRKMVKCRSEKDGKYKEKKIKQNTQ